MSTCDPPTGINLSTIYIELTAVCNNRCIGCGNIFIDNKLTRKTNSDGSALSISEWQDIIDKLALSITSFNITGGEPTLYEQFGEFMTLLDECEAKFMLFTNARWHKPKKIVETLCKLNGLKGLLISLHGKNAATHEAFTQIPYSYDETIKNIKSAIDAGISVTTNAIITRHSYYQIREIYHLGHELGVKEVVFNRYIGLLEDDCMPTVEQFKRATTEIENLRVSGGVIKSVTFHTR